MNNATVPARFLHHPLVKDRYFCTLPRDLWDEMHNRIGSRLFDPELVELEDTLSSICGDHSFSAGFKNGLAFTYNLRRAPIRLKLDQAKASGIASNQAALDRVGQIAEERSGGMAKVTRAYTGWLMTNPVFLNELDALLGSWVEMIRRWGFDRLGILLPQGNLVLGDDPTADHRWPSYSSAFDEFFTRWRLQGLAAPYLPVPLQGLTGGQFPVSVLPQVMRAGGAFVLPDTVPIPSRDTLRNMLEDSLHRSATPDHLEEWMRIIAGGNTAKKPFVKFSRLFEVQHYYRILRQRHAPALNRKLHLVKQVLAEFLGTAKRTIVEDLKFLKRRLGPQWFRRGSDT
jgi:hypothetical protein